MRIVVLDSKTLGKDLDLSLLEKLGDVSESEMNRITEALRVSIDV